MRKIHFREDEIVPCTEQRLKEFERLIGERLPDDYRAYLEHFAGSSPYIEGDSLNIGYLVRVDWAGKLAGSTGSEALLEYAGMLMPNPDDTSTPGWTNDLRYLFKTFKERIPHDTIIIWGAGGPDHFILGIKGTNRGKVFLWSWDYEHCDDNDQPTYNNVAFVANSFTEFIQMIEQAPDDWDLWEAAGKPRLPLSTEELEALARAAKLPETPQQTNFSAEKVRASRKENSGEKSTGE